MNLNSKKLRQPEQVTNNESTAHEKQVSPSIANAHVVGNQSLFTTDEEIKTAKDFVWHHMTGYDKNLMIKMSSKEFVELPELRFYFTACVVKEGVATDLKDNRQ